MKRIYFLAALCALASTSFAQKNDGDSTKVTPPKNDTLRIGNILIIKKHKGRASDSIAIVTDYSSNKRNKKLNTNYLVLDIGFANWSDQTNYSAANSMVVNRAGTPAFSADDMRLRGGKSANINLWLFMQKLALVKNNVNLKYGFGVEWDNYNFRSPTSLREGGKLPNGTVTNAPFVFRDSVSFSKNKLNLKYLTVPLMLNFATTKAKGKPSLSASVGVSAGYLIRQRNKQISDDRDKQRNQGEFNMQKFKLSYIAELGFGSVRLYGSYSPKSIFEKGLDIRPFTIGFRLSNW